MAKKTIEQIAYPTTKEGLPVRTEELALPYLDDIHQGENEHHEAFYARMFGSLAISQTFRDLEERQKRLSIPAHVYLHQRYRGVKMPDMKAMLDEIEDNYYQGKGLRVRVPDVKGYVHQDITDDLLAKLKMQYHVMRS